MKRFFIVLSILVPLIIATVITLVIVLNKETSPPPNQDPPTSQTPQNPSTPVEPENPVLPKKETVGVWWWNDSLDVNEYITFAKGNGVNEIYYSSSEFGTKTRDFIEKANNEGIEVYYLQGEYQWLDNDTTLHAKITKYNEYQTAYPNAKFSGIHLDIEPHQNPTFEAKRSELILKLITLASELKQTYSNITFDYDIPFWLDDEISFNNATKPAYQHMIDVSNRVFVMSYRDTAEKIKEKAIDELTYAISKDKEIVFCVETYSLEGDKVSFLEEGKEYMMNELKKLKDEFGDSIGIAIHHIKTWKELKD